jgi:hypothetical protein
LPYFRPFAFSKILKIVTYLDDFFVFLLLYFHSVYAVAELQMVDEGNTATIAFLAQEAGGL